MYLMIVVSGRQRKKQEKEREEMLSAMKKGDKVETGGGIIGKIVKMESDTVTLLVDEKKDVNITFRKSMVRQVIK